MNDDTGITWKEPPMAGKRVWYGLLKEVMERPGEWAHVRTMKRRSGYATVSKLRNHDNPDVRIAIPAGEWEFEGREVEGVDATEIYARYLGPADG